MITRLCSESSTENCGVTCPAWGTNWIRHICQIPIGVPLQCACERQGPVYLRMRGLACPQSYIDINWVPQNPTKQFIYAGFSSSLITFNRDSNMWEMNVNGKPLATSATSDATFHSFLLGKSDWLVSNDSKYLCIYLCRMRNIILF